jgi:predicted metalloprotease
VSSANEKKPGTREGLRLVQVPKQKPVRTDPELKAILDDMRRRYRVQRERAEGETDGKDAA